MTSIEQAKDRAQITAATSMSIVHVAVLKDILDSGPEGNTYYTWVLAFTIAALSLQIISGIISLYIALLRYYYTEYSDDFLDDGCKTCCPFRCRRIKHNNCKNIDAWMNQPNSKIPEMKSINHMMDENMNDENEETDENKCFPFECTTMRFAEFEYQVLQLFDTMSEELIRADLTTANYEIEMKWLNRRETKLKNALDKYTENVDEEAKQNIIQQLKNIEIRKETNEERLKNAEELRAQGEILQKHVEDIQEERVLKRATFWQNWLNMMMYTVFVLNACIAGFGLTSTKVIIDSPSVNSTVG